MNRIQTVSSTVAILGLVAASCGSSSGSDSRSAETDSISITTELPAASTTIQSSDNSPPPGRVDGTSGSVESDDTSATPTAGDITSDSGEHQQELARGETPFIVRYLVPVDGYRYADATDVEIGFLVDEIEAVEAQTGSDAWGGFSLHSVIADDPSQNTTQGEVGFLYLVEFNEPIPYGSEEEYATNSIEVADLIDRFDVSGVQVFVFENPQRPDSRYHYVWFENGVGGTIDGADRGALDTWVTAYLQVPKLAKQETPELDARLIAIPGYGYVDFDTTILESYAIDLDAALTGLHYSMHSVVDRGGSLGTLVLAETEDADPPARIAALFGLDETGEIELAGHSLRTFEDSDDLGGMYALTWTESGISGFLGTNTDDLDTAQQFLEAFLQS